jgi:hypothetical protein
MRKKDQIFYENAPAASILQARFYTSDLYLKAVASARLARIPLASPTSKAV